MSGEDATAGRSASAADGRLPALGRFVARHSSSRLARALASLSRRYLAWHGNLSYDLETNGEAFLLERLSGFAPKVVFDVGANVGDWSLAAHRRCPTATVEAFEIAPPTFQRLEERTASLPRVRCTNLGLSDAAGEVTLRHYPGLPALTTATDYPHPFPSTELLGRVEPGDALAARLGVERIDLLKIDVEGMEPRVLAGFSGCFERGAIELVQFEYGRVNILSRFLLRDFYAFFTERGYRVGKLYPERVDFRPYDLADEDFLGPNYVACRSLRADLVEALSGR